jgi:hypothetical protein
MFDRSSDRSCLIDLYLEMEILNSLGLFGTRVEAFIETLEPVLYKGG